ncbi:hypothetical protein VULLAG_LOCUS21868 [Vulpes lagopus]
MPGKRSDKREDPGGGVDRKEGLQFSNLISRRYKPLSLYGEGKGDKECGKDIEWINLLYLLQKYNSAKGVEFVGVQDGLEVMTGEEPSEMLLRYYCSCC